MTRDMQDNLEKFVKEHKDEFDDLIPNNSTWKNIHKELEVSNYAHKLMIWKVAAMLLLVFSLGLTVFINRDYFEPKNVVVAEDNEFLDTEAYYSSVIDQRQQLIKTVAHSFPDIENDFELDWKQLDLNYKQLKQEYEKDKSEELRNAIVQNLRARVSLLNRQIEVLRQIELIDDKTIEI